VYRPTARWRFAAGVDAHPPLNFLDLDPYGEPCPGFDAFLLRALRQKCKMNGAWTVRSMQSAGNRRNAVLYELYRDGCRDPEQEKR
jgi:hypothetical protein